jgi:hypothetical protein
MFTAVLTWAHFIVVEYFVVVRCEMDTTVVPVHTAKAQLVL